MADFAPGAYTVTYKPAGGSAASIGETEGPKRWQMAPLAEIVRADSFGRRIVDAIDQGQDWFVQMILKEWNSAVEAALYPFGSTYGTPTVIAGRLYSKLAGELVLTSVASTEARTLGPGGASGIITIALAIVMPDNQVEALLGNVERNTPVTFLCLPDSSGVVFVES